MSERRPIIAANWKMHKQQAEARSFAQALLPRIEGADDVDVVVAPPFTALAALAAELGGSAVALAAQNVNPEEQGAYTGEIAAGMLAGALGLYFAWMTGSPPVIFALFGLVLVCLAPVFLLLAQRVR